MPVYRSDQLPTTQPKRNKYAFLILWVIGHALAWASVYGAMGLMINSPISESAWTGVLALTLGTVTSLTQYLLIRWQFGRNIKSWLPLSIITWLFAGFVLFPPTLDLGVSQMDVTIQALALFAPAAVIQSFLLRKHVQNSWLWLLATIAGTSTFALSVTVLDWLDWSVYAGYGLYASTTALSLLWLFGMSGTQMKEVNEDRSYYRLMDLDDSEFEDYDYQQEIERRRRLGGK